MMRSHLMEGAACRARLKEEEGVALAPSQSADHAADA